jgi:hypothetical protein
MTEIRIVRRQRGILPWIVGLVLLVAVIWGVAHAARHPAAAQRPKATATDASWDNIPPRLRQYA